MKMQWSIISLLLLFTIVSCGKEEFATAPVTNPENIPQVSALSHSSCSAYTLIKPKVDVLYVIDNSSSSYYVSSQVKQALSDTITTLSSDFDFRVIGTPLLETSGGDNDYQVMTNSTDLQGIPSDSRRISTSERFSFFSNSPVSGSEKGLSRIISFINQHKGLLIRPNSYFITVVVSNGRDLEVEEDSGYGNGETRLNLANWDNRLASFQALRSSLGSLQFRLFSVTARSVCATGYRTAEKSYVKMANQLYTDSKATDSSLRDSYDICNSSGISSIFQSINSSIKQVIKPHEYKYWPITFAENNETVDINEINVTKISQNGTNTVLVKNTDWFYEPTGSTQTINTRVGPNPIPGPGEPYTGKHFVRFAKNVVYPDCILVTSKTRVEYFQYIVLPQKPSPGFTVKVRGIEIPQSSTNGWSFNESAPSQTINIKAPYPTSSDQYPVVMRTGFVIKLNGVNNYYRSGESIEVTYVPAPI